MLSVSDGGSSGVVYHGYSQLVFRLTPLLWASSVQKRTLVWGLQLSFPPLLHSVWQDVPVQLLRVDVDPQISIDIVYRPVRWRVFLLCK